MSGLYKNRHEAMAKWRECKGLEDVIQWHLDHTPWLGRDTIIKHLPVLYADRVKDAIRNEEISPEFQLPEASEFETEMQKLVVQKL